MNGLLRDVTNVMASPGANVNGLPVRTQLGQDEPMRMLTGTCVFGSILCPCQLLRRY